MQTLLECFIRINLIFFSTQIDVYNESFHMFDRPMSNIGLLPNFAHVYFWAESGMSLIISNWLSVYRNGTRIPGNNVHNGGQILSKKYQHVEQEDKNWHFKGVIAMKCLRNPTKHVKLLCLAHFDMPFPPHVAQRVAQGVTVEREFRYKLSFKIWAIRHLHQKFGTSPAIERKYFYLWVNCCAYFCMPHQ